MEKTEMQPSSLTALTDDKLARFVLGHQKKTKFQKEREDREAKKRKADEEAANIYATFVASFDNEEETKGKAFVRAGAQTDNKSMGQSGDVYQLKGTKPRAFSSAASGRKTSEMDKLLQEMKQTDARQQSRDQVQMLQRPKKRRAIDEFLEEMKERGPAPVSMEAAGMVKGSFDNGDPETTNLYVGNLAPTVTEEALKAEFGRYGEVYSVKIMWPRSEEERARRRNCGFVSFYERRDADDARVNLDNKELEGQPIIVGWGKAVKIQPRGITAGMPLPSLVTAPPGTTAPAVSYPNTTTGQQTVTIIFPTDQDVKRHIDHLARYVAADGFQFENVVRMREANNAVYRFLFEPQSVEALYYRWRVYSFAMGDDEHSWRVEPFQMTQGGPVWIPPELPTQSPDNRNLGTPSRSTRRSSDQRNHSKSRSYSRSRSRSSSSSPRRSRRRSRSYRRRSRSSSTSSSDNHRRYRRSSRRHSRSRSRGRSRSRSSDGSNSRKRVRRSRSNSHRDDRRYSDTRNERSRNDACANRSGYGRGYLEEGEKMLTGQQIARARDMERGRERNRLSSEDYNSFKELLEELTLERQSVKKTMGFALDNSEAAVDLVDIIFESFKSSIMSGVTLIGLLYLTSDILHNSSAAVKNASLFRTTFQERLPEIMDTLRIAHKNIVGRMSANAMKEKVINVLTAWENWSLFPPAVLVGFHATFLRKVEEEDYISTHRINVDEIGEADLERLRKTCRQAGIMVAGDAERLVARLQWLKDFTSPTTALPPGRSVAARIPSIQPDSNSIFTLRTITNDIAPRETKNDPHNIVEADGVDDKSRDEDLDGDPIDGEVLEEPDDVDGEPMDDNETLKEKLHNDGDTAEDELDGEPLDDEDLDGAPMDEEDLDGEPI
ncbi:hypothetical protein DVH05_008462 [Phytophthora capsici]|nr:hypothetical protein DVH05_008462 [Phytophthora capsici]